MEGGGASRTTESAAGTSTATDVSLLEHVKGMILAERTLMDERRVADQALAKALRDGDVKAVSVAFTAQETLTKAHNGLLRKMEVLVETFPTKESMDRRFGTMADLREKDLEAIGLRFTKLETWQAKATGAILIVSAVGSK